MTVNIKNQEMSGPGEQLGLLEQEGASRKAELGGSGLQLAKHSHLRLLALSRGLLGVNEE